MATFRSFSELKAAVHTCKEWRVIRVKWGRIVPKHGFNRAEYMRDGQKLLSTIARG